MVVPSPALLDAGCPRLVAGGRQRRTEWPGWVESKKRNASAGRPTGHIGGRTPSLLTWMRPEAVILPSGAWSAAQKTYSRAWASHRGLLSPLQIDMLDHVAEIAGGIPERFAALRLPDSIERAHHDACGAGPARRPRRAPFAERVAAKIGGEIRASPQGAAVRGDLHLLDAVPA